VEGKYFPAHGRIPRSERCARGGVGPIFEQSLFSDPAFYIAAIPAVIVLGLAKGGFSGLGMLATPILAFALPPAQAAAILLPILIVQDVVGLWVFRGTWRLRLVLVLAGGAVFGIAAGYALATFVSDDGLKLALGATSLVFALYRLWVERGSGPPAWQAPDWAGAAFGAASGFTSQIAHAGGPPAQMYLMPMRLERDVLIGTTTLFFAIVNWLKVPAYLALGQFTQTNLTASGLLLPLAVSSTYFGAWAVRRVNEPLFYRIAYVLMVLMGGKLIWDGASSLLTAPGGG